MKNQSSLFPDIDLAKISRINLQRNSPGQRGPGQLVQSSLPIYTEHEELVGLCESTGPGRYKAFALCEKGKPLGPAWAYEVAEQAAPAPATVLDDDTLRKLRAAHQHELDTLRASTADELDALRTTLKERAARELEDALHAAERKASVERDLIELEANRRVDAAERAVESLKVECENVIARKDHELSRAHRQLEAAVDERADLDRRLHAARERIADLERASGEDRLRYMEKIQQLEAELSVARRTHEAELREARNGPPEIRALSAQWEIERSRTLLEHQLAGEASANSWVAKFVSAIKEPEVQEMVFPMLNSIIETVMSQKSAPKRRAQVSAEG